jgi:hypothetical protein
MPRKTRARAPRMRDGCSPAHPTASSPTLRSATQRSGGRRRRRRYITDLSKLFGATYSGRASGIKPIIGADLGRAVRRRREPLVLLVQGYPEICASCCARWLRMRSAQCVSGRAAELNAGLIALSVRDGRGRAGPGRERRGACRAAARQLAGSSNRFTSRQRRPARQRGKRTAAVMRGSAARERHASGVARTISTARGARVSPRRDADEPEAHRCLAARVLHPGADGVRRPASAETRWRSPGAAT